MSGERLRLGDGGNKEGVSPIARCCALVFVSILAIDFSMNESPSPSALVLLQVRAPRTTQCGVLSSDLSFHVNCSWFLEFELVGHRYNTCPSLNSFSSNDLFSYSTVHDSQGISAGSNVCPSMDLQALLQAVTLTIWF